MAQVAAVQVSIKCVKHVEENQQQEKNIPRRVFVSSHMRCMQALFTFVKEAGSEPSACPRMYLQL
jgi:hypothetical protein